MRVDLAERMGQFDLFGVLENHPLTLAAVKEHREVVATHHHVLGRADDRRTVGRAEDVVGRQHQRVGLDLRLDGEWQMHGHLVTVEVGVEALADQRMKLDRIPFNEHRLERLNAHAMQGGGTIQQHRVVADHLFEDIPYLGILPLQHLLGALDGIGMAEFLEPPNDERLVELQGDLFRQTALVESEVGAHHDHAACGVIDALAKQVFTEPALLALDHVGEALERAVARSQHGPLAAIVVEERIDRLLQHPLLVADDHLGRIEVDQLLEAVVAIDDPAVQIVEVARGEVARVEHDQRPQIRRDDRDHVEHDPLRLVFAVADGFNDLQAVDEVLLLLLAVGRREVDAEVLRERHEVKREQQFANRFGAHLGLEAGLAVGVAGLAEFLLGEQLLLLQRRVLGVEHDVVLEVDHLLQAGGLHVEQRAQTAGHGLEEPDVDNRGGQFDMAHPLPANAAVRHFHAAAIADHPLVFHAAVFAAGAFPVLFRSENLLAHQAVFFRTVGAVVDRFGLLDLAKRPAANVVRPCQADLHGRIVIDAIVGGFADAHVDAPWNQSVVSINQRISPPLPLPGGPHTRRFSSCMLRARPRISLVSTSKLAGVPASSVFSPFTMLS